MVAGRPLKFATTEDLDKAIADYFSSLGENEPATFTGLALALDTTRQTLLEYREREEFAYSIARAKARCELYAEKQLFIGRNPSGAQFALRNNYAGWVEKVQTDTTHKGDKDNPIQHNVSGAIGVLVGEQIERILGK